MIMSGDIQIRLAVSEDVKLIFGFICALAEYEKLSHAVTASEELIQEHLFGPHPVAEAIIASLDGKPVGFALFFRTFSTFVGRPGIWLEDLFVLPEARGKRVGQAMLRHVASIAVQRNCGRLEWSALEWNEPAIRLYEKLGATRMDDWRIFRMTGKALAELAGRGELP
jgi:GNAT superfamily N-acetyltransferase